MKKNLRVVEGYALTKHKRKQYTIRYLSLLAVLTIMCLYAVKQVSAQQAEPAATAIADIKPLQIGDTIPEWLWQHTLQVVNHPEGKDTIELNFYRGRSLILDFWSTWCGSCLNGFPKMDSLQSAFDDRLNILLVNTNRKDTPEHVNGVLDRLASRKGYRLKLPYVLGDTLLAKVFPHRTIPHFVWVDKNGVVAATTHTRDMTLTNITDFLRTGKANVHMKKDIMGENQPKSLVSWLGADLSPVEYSSVLTGYIEGLTGSGRDERSQGSHRLYRFNTSIAALYNEAFKDERGNLPINRLIFEIPDSTGFRDDYLRRPDYGNMYCYELIAPTNDRSRLRHIMRNDLSRCFNVKITREKKRITTFHLKRGNGFDSLRSAAQNGYTKTIDGKVSEIIGMPVSYLVRTLNSRAIVHIINKAPESDRIDLKLPMNLEKFSPELLKKWLEKTGFSVTEAPIELDVAVFRPYITPTEN